MFEKIINYLISLVYSKELEPTSTVEILEWGTPETKEILSEFTDQELKQLINKIKYSDLPKSLEEQANLMVMDIQNEIEYRKTLA